MNVGIAPAIFCISGPKEVKSEQVGARCFCVLGSSGYELWGHVKPTWQGCNFLRVREMVLLLNGGVDTSPVSPRRVGCTFLHNSQSFEIKAGGLRLFSMFRSSFDLISPSVPKCWLVKCRLLLTLSQQGM